MSKGKFEQSIEQLEEIIEQIESGEIGLEDSITQYEKGSKLIEKCQAILNRAQARITELTDDGSGQLKSPSDDQAPQERE
ncbi:MAG TPA: exodeoxyribonuclease VII small subunit [Phycisphaerales bacterium]|nr:exodeoxyribonuclease VII small subunit [Phycisphaerales bacterium]|tara:strand:- start:55 stop:294 length:240 start_codon:yes stop_codon:yes gene_type:complete